MARGTRAKNAVRGPALRAGLGILLLAGCDDGGSFSLLETRAGGQGAATEAVRAARSVARDVEAPEVFQATDVGLWDGRPSLGGVWVAHPDVTEPARVIIRNTADGSFVIGALFRRQRDMPGPVFQVSSDAAAALGLLAGSPQQLDVTALRRERPRPGLTRPGRPTGRRRVARRRRGRNSRRGPRAPLPIGPGCSGRTRRSALPVPIRS